MHRKLICSSTRWTWRFPDGVLGRISFSGDNPAFVWMLIATDSLLHNEANSISNSCNCCKSISHIEPNNVFWYFYSSVPVFSSGANGQRLISLLYRSFQYLKNRYYGSFKSSLSMLNKSEMNSLRLGSLGSRLWDQGWYTDGLIQSALELREYFWGQEREGKIGQEWAEGEVEVWCFLNGSSSQPCWDYWR